MVDAAVGHSMFFFTDGFSGYNQIKIDPLDAGKTAFATLMGDFHYTIMSFGLNNVATTYQHAIHP